MKFITNIDLNKNELQNARIQNLATAPGTPSEGIVYYDTVEKSIIFYNGTVWLNVMQTISGLSADLAAIAAITETVGLLKKTAAATWSLDNTAYAPLANPTFTGTVTVDNLTVNGTTTTVNSTTVTFDDIILTIGGDTAPTVDDAKDRGISFRWYSTSAKEGFFGFDRSTGYFTFIPDATFTSDAVSGIKGTLDVAGITGNAATATALATARTIAGVSFDGSQNISLDTSNVSEHSSYLYYTDSRARAAISASGGVSYSSSTGAITLDGDLDAIAAITETVGVLKKTAANTWSLDTTYTRKYAASIGNGTDTTFTITHSLNTTDVIVQTRMVASTYDYVICDMKVIDANSVSIVVAGTPPTTNSIRVIVIG